MKSDVKKNLWEIVKYLLTLGVSAIVKLVQRKREKKRQLQAGQAMLDASTAAVPSKTMWTPEMYVSDSATRPVNDQIAEAMYDQGHIDPKP